jgi:hypothetical protein
MCGHDGASAEPEEEEGTSDLDHESSCKQTLGCNPEQKKAQIEQNGYGGQALCDGLLDRSSSSREGHLVDGVGGDWHPADEMSREQRMSLGLKCKQLIDAGRLSWLARQLREPLPGRGGTAACSSKRGNAAVAEETTAAWSAGERQAAIVAVDRDGSRGRMQPWHVRQVAYIQPSVSGENGLLLVSRSGIEAGGACPV